MTFEPSAAESYGRDSPAGAAVLEEGEPRRFEPEETGRNVP
jgi:hypothetical protein